MLDRRVLTALAITGVVILGEYSFGQQQKQRKPPEKTKASATDQNEKSFRAAFQNAFEANDIAAGRKAWDDFKRVGEAPVGGPAHVWKVFSELIGNLESHSEGPSIVLLPGLDSRPAVESPISVLPGELLEFGKLVELGKAKSNDWSIKYKYTIDEIAMKPHGAIKLAKEYEGSIIPISMSFPQELKDFGGHAMFVSPGGKYKGKAFAFAAFEIDVPSDIPKGTVDLTFKSGLRFQVKDHEVIGAPESIEWHVKLAIMDSAPSAKAREIFAFYLYQASNGRSSDRHTRALFDSWTKSTDSGVMKVAKKCLAEIDSPKR